MEATPVPLKYRYFPLRKRSGTAAFHTSRKAVNFGHEDLEKMSALDAVKFMAETIWGSFKEMPCTHCGTIDEHYWSAKEMRWKCKCCGKRPAFMKKEGFCCWECVDTDGARHSPECNGANHQWRNQNS